MTVAGALAFVGLGIDELGGAVDRLGMNQQSAVAHIAVGALVLAAWAATWISTNLLLFSF